MKWYLTEREYREEEEWLTGELEDEYGLIPEIRLLAENADYGRVRLQGTKPCVVLDFCDNEKVYGGGLAAGSIWLDFPASEEKERRVTSGAPGPGTMSADPLFFHEKRVERPAKSLGIP